MQLVLTQLLTAAVDGTCLTCLKQGDTPLPPACSCALRVADELSSINKQRIERTEIVNKLTVCLCAQG